MMKRSAACAHFLWWLLVLPGCSLRADEPALPYRGPTELIQLGVTTSAVDLDCRPAKGAATMDVQLKRTFFDDFQYLDEQWTRWHPHFDGGWDAGAKRWLGYDWPTKRDLSAGTKEQQLYVDRGYPGTGKVPLGLNPFKRVDGHLEITAERTPPALKPLLMGREFISGLLTSRPSLTQKHGFFEIRARMPAGKALWPAFWLLPQDKSWPPEIDVFEVVGQKPEEIVQTVHWKDAQAPAGRRYSSCRTRVPDSTSAFHQYGVLWTAQRIVFYIDRQAVAHMRTPPGYDQQMYLLMNLAVGGIMVGRADDETPLPAALAVEWVAAYQLADESTAATVSMGSKASPASPDAARARKP